MKHLKSWKFYLLMVVGVLFIAPLSLFLFTVVFSNPSESEIISTVEARQEAEETETVQTEHTSAIKEGEEVEQASQTEDETSTPETLVINIESPTLDLAYQLKSAEWRPFVLNYWPDANFLVLWVDVTNTGKKPLRVGTFKLVSETGAEYTESEHAGLVQKHWDKYTDINPEVTKEGLLIFDVPKNHKYKLQISHEEETDIRVIEISKIEEVL